jgi:hypothetical protein
MVHHNRMGDEMKIVAIGGGGLIVSKLVEKLREDGHEAQSSTTTCLPRHQLEHRSDRSDDWLSQSTAWHGVSPHLGPGT